MDDLAEELNSVKEQIENLEYKIAEFEKKQDAAKQAVSIEHDDVKRHRANLDLEDLCTHLSYLREEKKQLREERNLLLRLRLQSEQQGVHLSWMVHGCFQHCLCTRPHDYRFICTSGTNHSCLHHQFA
jgi:chromosome segregation ATPase